VSRSLGADGLQTDGLNYFKTHNICVPFIFALIYTCIDTFQRGTSWILKIIFLIYIQLGCIVNELLMLFMFCILQEVGSIIGKKGDNVKRFREDVSIL
jgi:hypothetical protein